LACKEREAGRNRRLEDTEEEAHCDRAGEVLRRGHAAEGEAPHYDIKRGPFGERETLEESIGGVFPGEVADVEHAAEPLVVGPLEMDVGLEAHDGGVGEGGLVEIIQAVDYAEHLHLLAG
jgi:hypothetical protein